MGHEILRRLPVWSLSPEREFDARRTRTARAGSGVRDGSPRHARGGRVLDSGIRRKWRTGRLSLVRQEEQSARREDRPSRRLLADTGGHEAVLVAGCSREHMKASLDAGEAAHLVFARSAARRDVGPLVVVADDAEDLQIRESRAASASDWPPCAPCFASSAGKRATRPPSRGTQNATGCPLHASLNRAEACRRASGNQGLSRRPNLRHRLAAARL